MAQIARMRMRLALLLPDLRMGGAQRVYLSLAGAFAQLGFDTELITACPDGDLQADIPQNVRHIVLTKHRPKASVQLAFASLPPLVHHLRRCPPHALFSTLTGTNLLASMAHQLAGPSAKLVLREGATLANLRHPTYRLAMRHAYRRAHAIVALTAPMKEQLTSLLACSPERVFCIPNHVDHDNIRRLSKEPLPADFDPSQGFVLAVGRLTAQKDYPTMIRAMAEIQARQSLSLVVVGEGPEMAALRSLATEYGLAQKVVFRGHDRNPYRWMARASALVLSSRWEGHPNVILEARALGLPIAATDYDPSARGAAGENGFLAPVGEPIALARAIEQAIVAPPAPRTNLTGPRDSAKAYLKLLCDGELPVRN